jgi:hypothetical protein
VTIQAVVLILLGCLFLGMLLGTTFTVQAIRPEFRRQAHERRRLDAEWHAIQQAEQVAQPEWCPRCGHRLAQAALHSPILYDAREEEPDGDD